jgi:hypothetical protein
LCDKPDFTTYPEKSGGRRYFVTESHFLALDVEVHLFGASNQEVAQNDPKPQKSRRKQARNHAVPIGALREFIRRAPF